MTCLLIGLLLVATSLPEVNTPAGLLEERLLKETPASLANAAREQGDAARGALVFYQPSLTCTRCHLSEKGDPIGPDLAKIGREATDADLIESILHPSKVVKKGFETVAIATTDGKTVTGLLVEDRADQLVLRDPSEERKLVTVWKREIEQRTDGGPSIMPAGLVNGLSTRQEFLDLIRYLRAIADGGAERARALAPDPSRIAGLVVPTTSERSTTRG